MSFSSGLINNMDRKNGNYANEVNLVKVYVPYFVPKEFNQWFGYVSRVTFNEVSIDKLCKSNADLGENVQILNVRLVFSENLSIIILTSWSG